MADDLYNEIREDLQQQKLREFWKENGPWIIGGIIAAIVFTAGLSWWRDHEAAVNMEGTGGLIAAVETADPAKIEAFAASAGKQHAFLAKMALAELYASRKDASKAAAAYDEAAKTPRIGGQWKDLAKLYSIGARLDTGDAAALHKELEGLAGSKDPWRFSALEMQALLHAREGRTAEAVKMLDKIAADSAAPEGARARAATLRALYAGGGNEKGNG